jgi:hypothetical protein
VPEETIDQMQQTFIDNLKVDLEKDIDMEDVEFNVLDTPTKR